LGTGFGNFLRDFRARSKMTQEDFAQKVGVTTQTVLKWEKMRCFPSRIVILKKLASRLEIPFHEFFKIKEMRKLQRRQNMISQSKDPVISASWLNYVPILDGRTKALPIAEITNPARWKGERHFLPEDLFSGFIFAFRIGDQHMQSSYCPGDIVLADVREPLKIGYPVVIKVKNNPPVCRIYSSEGNLKVLSAVDTRAPLLNLKDSDIEWCHSVIRCISPRFN